MKISKVWSRNQKGRLRLSRSRPSRLIRLIHFSVEWLDGADVGRVERSVPEPPDVAPSPDSLIPVGPLAVEAGRLRSASAEVEWSVRRAL